MTDILFDPTDWYWRVGNSDLVYSSARRAYVPTDDPEYSNWDAEPEHLVAPIPTEEDLKAYLGRVYPAGLPVDLQAYAAEMRWQLEVSGILVSGMPIPTNRESQALIHGAFSLAQTDPDFSFQFKVDGHFVTLSASQVIAIGEAVARHIQACFVWEADMLDQISSGAVTTETEINAAMQTSF